MTRTPEEMWRTQAELYKGRCDEFGRVAQDLIERGEAQFAKEREGAEPRFDVFTLYAVQRLTEALKSAPADPLLPVANRCQWCNDYDDGCVHCAAELLTPDGDL